MTLAMTLVVLLVAMSHLVFMVMEMFFWTHYRVRRIFGMSKEKAIESKVLAGNLGLYNGFLAAGLLWGLWLQTPGVLIFFLLCVLIAGIYGGLTSKPRILLIQGLPAAVGLVLVFLNLF